MPLSSTACNRVIAKQWFLTYGQSREVAQTLAISMFCHNVIFRVYSLIKIGSGETVSCLNMRKIPQDLNWLKFIMACILTSLARKHFRCG